MPGRLQRQAGGTVPLADTPRRLDILTEIAAEGFRFPTSDEWEMLVRWERFSP